MKTIVGRCKYCGVERSVIAENQEDADLQVEKACDCSGADKAEKKKLLHKTLDELAGSKAADLGFTSLDPDTYQIVKMLGDKVVDEIITKVNLKIAGTVIVITNTGGRISAVRTRTYKQGGNIE